MATSIQLRIKRAPGSDDVPLPTRMTSHAAGFDLSAAVEAPVTLRPGDIQLISCGFSMSIPPGYEAQIRPRSGLASKHGITMINSPGTIDADYRGEVRIPLINLGREDFVIERGMRIAQMVIGALPSVDVIETERLDETSRGEGGFGHTGH